MARDQGANAQLAVVLETTYGTKPASGFRLFPFASTTLGADQPLIDNELLGFGRDPLAPSRDAITVDGNVVIPIDARNLGVWLAAAFGNPVTTGASPYVHTYESGSSTLRSLSAQKALPSVPSFEVFTGVRVDSLSWTMQRSGLLQMTAALVARGATKHTTTQTGALSTAYALQRFNHFQGSIERDASALGNIVSAEITYSNNLDRIETIRADGLIDGADPTIASLRGSITTRFADATLYDQAVSGGSCELVFRHEINANTYFEITAHEVYLPRPRIEIPGPAGIQATFDWQASLNTAAGAMCTVVLGNDVASY